MLGVFGASGTTNLLATKAEVQAATNAAINREQTIRDIADDAAIDANRANTRLNGVDTALVNLGTTASTHTERLNGIDSRLNGVSVGVTSLEEGERMLRDRVTALENADMPSSGSGVSQEDIDNTIGGFNTNRDHPLYDGEGGTGSSTTNYDTVGEAVQDALYYNCLLYTSPSPRD